MSVQRSRRLSDRRSGPATLINHGCKITGTVTGSSDFQVSGEIDGDCDLEGTVILTKDGLWRGTIRAGNVIIAGHVEGDIIAAESVEIMDSARINGTVSGEAIAVAEGAVVEGEMKTTGKSEPSEFVEKRTEDESPSQ